MNVYVIELEKLGGRGGKESQYAICSRGLNLKAHKMIHWDFLVFSKEKNISLVCVIFC